MKKMSKYPEEVIDIYFKMSQPLLENGGDLYIENIRKELKAEGFDDTDKNGNTYDGAGLRLQINRVMGDFKVSGILKGNWENKDAFDSWKDERFCSIKNPTIMPNFDKIFNKYD